MIIAIATCLENASLTESDAVFTRTLTGAGAEIIVAPWNGPFAPFAAADATIIRSTWDYYGVAQDFADWIGRVSAATPLFNAPDLLRWNMGKLYLLELAAAGIETPATRRVAPDADAIVSAMEALQLEQAIVKPVHSGTARGLSLVRRGEDEALRRAAAILGGEGLVQPFLPEIRDVGETSFVFIDGVYSHAVVKRARGGDIRVQAEFGGTAELVEPPDWAIEKARAVLKACPGEALYARIDAVVTARRIVLMEAELVEPELFFTYCPMAADRLAGALLNRLK